MEIDKIIEGCKSGKKNCQEVLVRTYAPVLLSICRRYTKDHESANDALQEAFINIFKYINSYSGKGSFEGWLKRIAVNCSITFQKKHFQKYHEPDVLHDSVQHCEIPQVYSTLGKEEILGLLNELPRSLFVVFNMSVIEGYNHKEISEILGISEGTSRASLSRARARVIEIIRQRQEKENQRVNHLHLI
ncbi:MAG: sigma-70 family RNA polymerase sigma factor [Saprospiraceae bacterium]|nr:sigma-70 family RNA polymerase sigma factor [Saprospiraceae bacterium]